MKLSTIIGPDILEKLKSSDYKNSVYAFAEIIDNSIDAEAKNIELITLTNEGVVTDIYFIDDGKGMTRDILQHCVIFSVSHNLKGSKKTGIFGMGLPNASLSQCSHFSVLALIDDKWIKNSVNISKMKAKGSLDVEEIYIPPVQEIKDILSRSKIKEPKTIVHWTSLDNIDSVRASTIMNRTERLIGRIHRYKIRSGLNIRFLNYSDNNETPDIDHSFVENDPLYLTAGKSWIAFIINKLAKEKTDPNPLLSLNTYFSQFIFEDDETRVKPLFYLPEEAQEIIEIEWMNKTYQVFLRLAVAYPAVQKPGRRNGGGTDFGKQLGIKVKGTLNYPSGNISWIRNDREITCGNYSLFNVTQENQRFWSIELAYYTNQTNDNVLDKLLGLSNSKQSIRFNPDKTMPEDTSSTASINLKRQELIAKITVALNTAIGKAKKILSQQARAWNQKEENIKGTNSGGEGLPGPTNTTYTVLLDALGKGAQLDEDSKRSLVQKLKRYLPNISNKQIIAAVEKYNDIGLQNIIIYCEIDDRDLFQSDKFQGINITLINIKHHFYKKIIAPLKDENKNDLLASIELLISSLSRSGQNNFFEESLKDVIKEYQELFSKDIKQLLTKQEEIGPISEDDEDE